MERVCGWCGLVLVRKEGERKARFIARSHCDKRCAVMHGFHSGKRRSGRGRWGGGVVVAA